MSLQLFYYRHNKHLPTISRMPQRLNYYELTFVIEGEIEYLLNDATLRLKTGDTVFIQPKTVRARKAIQNADYISFNFLADEGECNFPTLLSTAMTDVVKLLLHSFDNIYNETPSLSDERLNLIFECIVKQLRHQMEKKTEHPLVLRIKRHVKERLNEKLTLEEISRITFFSPSYCESVFKKETGKSIIDYVLDERIALAKTLLWESGYTLPKIAEVVGFNDYNYFARAFKKKTGYTPTEYVKKSIF
ncbi:MAG: helix-turn-helix domain-containing protein [Clostridia bacterium]|nr:helix-turn-helix domain-containing protein [Clostridia bacterium]